MVSTTECHQYKIKKELYQSDLSLFDLTDGGESQLKVSDFDFEYVEKGNVSRIKEAKDFIKKYEYLRSMPQRPTHTFITTLNGKIAGVQVLSVPNMFSTLLGPSNSHLEKLLSRGACFSLAPKNLPSWQIMNSVRWMVKNTTFRLFSGYADPRAGEQGQIYRACNFIELPGDYGGKIELCDPRNPGVWFSDREARKLNRYKRYARELGVEWKRDWCTKGRVLWSKVPNQIEEDLRRKSREFVRICDKRKLPPKRKFILIKGRNKREERELLRLLYLKKPELNPKFHRGLD